MIVTKEWILMTSLTGAFYRENDLHTEISPTVEVIPECIEPYQSTWDTGMITTLKTPVAPLAEPTPGKYPSVPLPLRS
jgi:hypothetical protein